MPIRCAFAVAALLVALSRPAFGQPAVPTLISPSADVTGSTIAFSWHSVPNATWYQLWLGTLDASLVLEQWHTAEHAGCANGATCTVLLTPPISGGAFIWYVRAWGPSGYGGWSTAMTFTFKDPAVMWGRKLPPARRFTLVLDNSAVLDNETGLVWERAPATGTVIRATAANACSFVQKGARLGWRLPTLPELQSLGDPTMTNPILPAGHPFTLGTQPWTYWTVSRSFTGTDNYVLDFAVVNIAVASSGNYRVWCVRGGTSPSQ